MFEKEAVLGRDVDSVFPTEAKQADQDLAASAEALVKDAIGSVQFVTEKQVEELKRGREGEGDAAAAGSLKPLAQVLSERKQEKDDAFQEKWKQMKEGQYRPLDEDEAAFLDDVEAKRRKVEDSRRAEEQNELLAFQLAREEAREQPSVLPSAPKPAGQSKPQARQQKGKPKKAAALLRVKVQPKAQPKAAPKPAPEPEANPLGSLVPYGSDSDSD